MKKMMVVLLLIIIILIPIEAYSQDFNLKEDEIDIETSIVLLNIYNKEEIIRRDYFFEILDFQKEGYILIPINLLSNNLDLVVIYDRLSNIISVKNPENENQVKIDLEMRKFIEKTQFNEQLPVVYQNDIFVNTEVISYLFNAEVNWDSNYQELSIIGDFPDQDEIGDRDIEVVDKEKLIEEKKEEVLAEKDKFSLGSINYLIEIDYRKSNLYADSLNLREVTSIFGRAGNWALSLRGEGELDYYNQTGEFELPFIKGKYEDEQKLIVIGDTSINFDSTVGQKKLRGLYFRRPNNISADIVPKTDIKGEVPVGSEVKLYVNNEPPRAIVVQEDGQYNFEDVTLKLKVLNTIRIIITKPDGTTEIIEKNITATERILNKGTGELEAAAGNYTGSSGSEYEGLIGGFKGSYALNEDISFKTEANYFDTRYLEEDKNYIVSNIGLAYRLIDNTIVTLDWYYGDLMDKQESSYKANIHYAFNKGFIDGYYLYIENNLSEYIEESPGKEQKVMGVFSFNKNWYIEPTIGTYESLNIQSPMYSEYIKLKLNGNNRWGHDIAILASYETIEKNYIVPINNIDYLVPGINNKYGAGFIFKRYHKGFNLKLSTNIFDNNIEIASGETANYQDIDHAINIYKIFTDNLLLTANYETEYENYDGLIQQQELERNIRMRYRLANRSYFTLSNKYTYFQANNYEENRYSAIINTQLGDNINIYGQYTSIDSFNIFDYNELSVDTFYNINKNSYINLFANYIMPEDDTFTSKVEYGLGYNQLFNNKAELEFTVGKNYQNVLGENHEYYFVISYAQGISFGDNQIIQTRFSENSHRSIVTGYVYLDENSNGEFDEGEEKLPGIEMRLDNLVATTDQSGQFRFNPLFADDYILDFNYRNLAADYTPVTKEKLIVLRENENAIENFALTLNGSISGKIFLDENNNGIQDEGEEPISWVGVSLDDKKYKYTDKRGEFYFENVSLGSHTVTIVQESIPSTLSVKDSLTREVNINKNDLDVQKLIIPLYYDF